MLNEPLAFKPSAQKSSLLIVDILQTIIVALAITVVIYLFIATPHQVDGKSMEKTFYNGELLLTNKIIQLVGDTSLGRKLNYDYERGDVVIFQQEGKPDFIKRIIAKEGDRIRFVDNKLIINGKEVEEFYIPNSPEFKTELPDKNISFLDDEQEITVPQSKYFVMGDNRQHSQDSRFSSVGFVDRSEIKGKVFIRYWPLSDFGLIPRGSFNEIDFKEE